MQQISFSFPKPRESYSATYNLLQHFSFPFSYFSQKQLSFFLSLSASIDLKKYLKSILKG
jgi:hypothetical protein